MTAVRKVASRWRLAVATPVTIAVAAMAGGLLTPGTASAAYANTSVADVAKTIGATSTAATGLDGRGVGIALIDTGVVGVAGLPKAQVVNGPDLSMESQASGLRYLDTYGHGTHMAGIIVGNDTTAGLKGIATKAKLTSVKVATATGAVDISQVMAAVDWVIAHRNDDSTHPIKVLSLSFGTNSAQQYYSDPLSFAVERAWKAGIVVVVAAGNTGASTNNMTNPGYNPYVLTVGSSKLNGTISQSDDEVSAFTPLTSSGRRIDLVAPGEGIVSLRDPNSYLDDTYPGARVGDRLFKGSGTSQAAAVVAGAAALLLQKRPTLKPDQVKTLLMNTGTLLTRGTAAGKNIRELNLAAAIPAATPTTTQTHYASNGTGSLEIARGSGHLQSNGTPLQGEFGLFGPISLGEWSTTAAAGNAWVGGKWMGNRMAGDGWTGSSWASKTWAGATWAGTTWNGESWTDDSWTGRYWTTGGWSGRYWSGRYWSGDDWEAAGWGG